eukprot:TRINITY_DN78851_c0_g1_i1.p1 TRINITY_DN78851_c0_g1~~TRINITY_DN78851_c0_g1_i1.p1  ORF type:complete len:307 (+),score=79.22 TRINITY_DN78851_c0_g1_i1:96-923(+)
MAFNSSAFQAKGGCDVDLVEAPQYALAYKTRMCLRVALKMCCPLGEACSDAHSKDELRPLKVKEIGADVDVSTSTMSDAELLLSIPPPPSGPPPPPPSFLQAPPGLSKADFDSVRTDGQETVETPRNSEASTTAPPTPSPFHAHGMSIAAMTPLFKFGSDASSEDLQTTTTELGSEFFQPMIIDPGSLCSMAISADGASPASSGQTAGCPFTPSQSMCGSASSGTITEMSVEEWLKSLPADLNLFITPEDSEAPLEDSFFICKEAACATILRFSV